MPNLYLISINLSRVFLSDTQQTFDKSLKIKPLPIRQNQVKPFDLGRLIYRYGGLISPQEWPIFNGIVAKSDCTIHTLPTFPWLIIFV